MQDGLKSICLLAAKKLSRRLPGKNKKIALGKPLFQYPLEAVIKAKKFDEIYVSTDDDEIAKIAAKMKGARVDRRPSHLTGDDVSVPEVISELLERLGGSDRYGIVGRISATRPLVQTFHIKDAYDIFAASDALCLQSVSKSPFFPETAVTIEKGYIKKDWKIKRIDTSIKKTFYYYNGVIAFYRCTEIMKYKTEFLENTIAYEMDDLYSLDVDIPDDFEKITKRMQMIKNTAS